MKFLGKREKRNGRGGEEQGLQLAHHEGERFRRRYATCKSVLAPPNYIAAYHSRASKAFQQTETVHTPAS